MTSKKITNPELLAAQLRCPTGEAGAAVAQDMNRVNQQANEGSIALLAITDNDRVLEVGPGNGAFAAAMLDAALGVHYTGVDWSNDMVAAATLLNRQLVSEGRAIFLQGDAAQLQFDDNTFDKILSVHTLYFWRNPNAVLSEIKRVIKPNGHFCLTWGDPSFMEGLPFTAYGFALYGVDAVDALLSRAGFCITHHEQYTESGLSNTGDRVEKIINRILCQKMAPNP